MTKAYLVPPAGGAELYVGDPVLSVAPRLCLSMIVKNERDRLERCLASVAPHISCWCICDTGSTDGTQALVIEFFGSRSIPGRLCEIPFDDFSTARNRALGLTQGLEDCFDCLLLLDADMELVVDQPFPYLTADAYQMLQRAGDLSYWNVRLLRRSAAGHYVGATHEALVVSGTVEKLPGIWFRDHADGANRPGKFQRDIKLLEAAIAKNPDDARSVYYTAQSYKDLGLPRTAAEVYEHRAVMGGWDEEAWHAKLQAARCWLAGGDEDKFVAGALAAFSMRPTRAEPLHDLARHYRLKGQNDPAVMFAQRGAEVLYPTADTLFIEDYPYRFGFDEELSIAGYYSASGVQYHLAHVACERLSLARDAPWLTRYTAQGNLYFYVRPLGELAPITKRRVEIQSPNGFFWTNPSIARCGDRLYATLRAVNYIQCADGHYEMPGDQRIMTRNFLARVDDDLTVGGAEEIMLPADLPEPAWDQVLGFEDMRLSVIWDALWVNAATRILTPEGWCEQVLGRVAPFGSGYQIVDWGSLQPPGERRHQKNWMPRVLPDGDLEFVYWCDPVTILDDHGNLVRETAPTIAAEGFRGGSQAIPFDGGWLAVIHEAQPRAGLCAPYHHRFIWLDEDDRLKRVSRRFYLNQNGSEFVCGLAFHPDGKRLLISYGVQDAEAWIASISAEDVRGLLLSI